MRFDRSHFHHLRRAWIAAELGADPRAWAGHGCGPRHGGCGPRPEEGRDERSEWRGERGDWREMRRDFGPRGPGGFGPRGPGGHHGPWGGPFEREPRRGRPGDVRVAVLSLLAEQASNGYQLIQRISERSGGRWQASPGSIYPTLQQLEDEGLIRASEQDGRKVFELTPQGHAELDASGSATERLWGAEDSEHSSHQSLRQAAMELLDAVRLVARSGRPEHADEARRLLQVARQGIFRLLAEDAKD